MNYSNEVMNSIEERKKSLIPLLFILSQELQYVFVSQNHQLSFDLKSNNEVISEFDIMINNKIFELLNTHFKQDGFISEESAPVASQNGFTWILDPIDGSSNFIYSVNLFCISLSIYYHDQPVLSFIVDPLKSLIYLSVLDKNWIVTQSETRAIDPVYSKEDTTPETQDYFLGGSIFANYKVHHIDPIKKEFYDLLEKADYYRTMGCIALEIVLSSLRKPFVFFTIKIRHFDVAAALHFATNMGYEYITGENNEFLLLYPIQLIANPTFKSFLESVKKQWVALPLNTLKI